MRQILDAADCASDGRTQPRLRAQRLGGSVTNRVGEIRRCAVGADVVEVAPAYDHAEITCVAAATVVFDILSLIVANGSDPSSG
jgi:hypothetical protein